MANIKLCCMWNMGLHILLLALSPWEADSAELYGHDIMQKHFYAGREPQLLNESTMTLTNEKGQQRVRKMRSASMHQANGMDTKLLIRFLFPGDVQGTGYLQVQHYQSDDDMWIYLTALKKVRRLVANNKRDSF